MESNLRKLVVAFIALAVIVGAYLLYSNLSETSDVDISGYLGAGPSESDANAGQVAGDVGMIGDVGVGTIQDARFEHVNKTGAVDRIFGFKTVLHEEGDEWEIESPFMNIIRPNLRCKITSETGKVQVETVAGRTGPKDATLTGNVVIHVMPEPGSKVEECRIYLDDITYLSSRSQFITAGPVRFVSNQAELIGTGMEAIFNEEENHLQLLKIANLESLRLKVSSQSPLFSSSAADANSVSGPAEGVEVLSPDAATVGRAQTKGSERTPQQDAGEYYKAVFTGNVIVETPEQVIFADQLSINNILWAQGASDRPDEAEDPSHAQPGKVPPPEETPQSTTPGVSEKGFVDIIAKARGGLIIAPMNFPQPALKTGVIPTVTAGRGLDAFGDTSGRATVVAKKIDYDALSEEVFLAGNCSCKMPKHEATFEQEYRLSAPKIWVKLADKRRKRDSTAADNVERVIADGGQVRLATVKTRGEIQLGFTKLECLKFDFDPVKQTADATGRGSTIVVDNAKVSPKKAERAKFGLQKQCYALVEGFDHLRYLLDSQRIIFDSGAEKMRIGYIPIADGKPGKTIEATAGHVEADIIETKDGRSELAMLRGTGGISYDEELLDPDTQARRELHFDGSEFLYDWEEGLLTARGDGTNDCTLNGIPVERIKYDLNTGQINAEILAPGMLPGTLQIK